jgi:hypothetical protein
VGTTWTLILAVAALLASLGFLGLYLAHYLDERDQPDPTAETALEADRLVEEDTGLPRRQEWKPGQMAPAVNSGGLPEEWTGPVGGHRVLAVVSEPVEADQIFEALGLHGAAGDLAVMVVAPALARNATSFHLGDADEAVQRAERACEMTVEQLRARGVAASGHVGAADPATATSDALRVFSAEQVLQFEHPPGMQRFREPAPVAQAAGEFGVPTKRIELSSR